MTIKFKQVNPRDIIGESRDCVVRASTIATGSTYQDMHSKYKAAGRRDKRGTPVFLIDEVLPHKQAIKADYRHLAWTLSKFISIYGKGRWVLCNRNHAWAVVDGVVHDTAPVGARTRVLWAWRVE